MTRLAEHESTRLKAPSAATEVPAAAPEPDIRPWPMWVRALIIIGAAIGLWLIIWAAI